MYTPDNWVIVKIVLPGEINYKVLAGWSGGYLEGHSWRMNSGITMVEEEGDYFLFHGYSGSIYRCHKDAEALRYNIAGILTELVKKHGEHMVSQIWYKEFINEFDPNQVP